MASIGAIFAKFKDLLSFKTTKDEQPVPLIHIEQINQLSTLFVSANPPMVHDDYRVMTVGSVQSAHVINGIIVQITSLFKVRTATGDVTSIKGRLLSIEDFTLGQCTTQRGRRVNVFIGQQARKYLICSLKDTIEVDAQSVKIDTTSWMLD